MSDDAATILDLAWQQIDTKDLGYIYERDFVLLIDAIDAILDKSILNETGYKIVKDYSRNSGFHKIYKTDFRSLFHSLIGTSFKDVLSSVSYDKRLIEKEAHKENLVRSRRYSRPVLTSTPLSKENSFTDKQQHSIDPPVLKKEFKKYKRLSANQEEEIKYRDEIIAKHEQREVELNSKISKLEKMNKLVNSLEDDVLYRDKIIIEKDDVIKEKTSSINKLNKKITSLKEELDIYKSNNTSEIDQYQLQKAQNFNKELVNKIQLQQQAIDKLKKTLHTASHIPSTQSQNQYSKSSSRSRKNFQNFSLLNSILPTDLTTSTSSFPRFHAKIPSLPIILCILSLLVLYFMIPWDFFTISSSSSSSDVHWYTNTFLEPWFYETFENGDIDYEYYNLDKVNLDYLPR